MDIKDHLYRQYENIRSLNFNTHVPYKYERTVYVDSKGNRVAPVEDRSLNDRAINTVK